jgi:serine/threonine protein kinase
VDDARYSEAEGGPEGKLNLNDFKFISTLGTGTFGRVRLVKEIQNKDADPMALKCLKKSEIIRLKQIDHIKSEKSILQSIDHPFIVKLFGTFQTPSHVFMLLDYACGGELFTLLRREGRFANDVALFFASEILLSFEYLHGMDIAYRDLKPENLLIDKEGHVKITDFGFAKIVKDRTYTLCGTPEYLAPEIIQSKGHNKFVDWWALGVLIFEMLAGYPPFYDDNPLGIYQKIMDGYYEFPPHVDPKARDLIKSFLCAERSLRLGCTKTGPEDIKAHKWFRGVDFDIVMSRKIPSPWVPKMKGNMDTQYFDKYQETAETPSIPTREQ